MTLTSDSWLTLIVSLPSASATARMRIWRAVKTLGCAALRDGAYLLPAQAEQAAQLQVLADEALQEGGQAWLGCYHPNLQHGGVVGGRRTADLVDCRHHSLPAGGSRHGHHLAC